MKKPKTYQQYKDEAINHNESIMAKYGAPPGARPPQTRDFIPSASDRQYRNYAFIYKRRLEEWPKKEKKSYEIPG